MARARFSETQIFSVLKETEIRIVVNGLTASTILENVFSTNGKPNL
jgi:hypothetical protein